jgi:hypothetical protein
MPSFKPLQYAALCTITAILSSPAWGADVGGSMRFSDEHFSVDIQTTDQTLHLTARGCNNFDLVLPPANRGAGLALRDSHDRNLGSLPSDRTIETRTCGAERYSTEFIFAAPTLTTWTPQVEELVGAKKVKYSATLSPKQIRFDPPIEITVYQKNTRSRPLRIADVASAEIQGGLAIVYSSNVLHFSTEHGTIHRPNGFASDDDFFVESESQRFARPANGHAEEIAFDAPTGHPASLSLYYPLGGPHVIAFATDERQRDPTQIKSLSIDGEQLLTPAFSIVRAAPIALKRGLFRFLSREQLAEGTVQIALGSADSTVSDVRITSSAPTVLQIAQTSSANTFAPSLELDQVPGAVPIDLTLRVRSATDLSLGPHNFKLTVTSEGGLKREIPITVNVSDPFARTRSLLFAGFIGLVVAVALWILVKRRRVESHAADTRAIFFQKHYGDYSETRERIEAALASDITWLKAAEVLEEFEEKELQTALTTQQWSAIKELATQQKGREALEALDRALAKLEG